MLSSSNEIRETAELLVQYLKAHPDGELKAEAWTQHIFATLRMFCEQHLGVPKADCFHCDHPDGKTEFLWDFIASSTERGIVLAAESEQDSYSNAAQRSLLNDFEKLLYVYAPIRLFLCKAKDEEVANRILEKLQEHAGRCCKHFNPGSAFLVHFCLWDRKRSFTCLWQSDGEPAALRNETLDFQCIPTSLNF